MKGLLIINHFLNTDKFNTLHKFILETADKQGIKLDIMTNLECMVDISCRQENLDKYEFILFWDKDILLARYLEKMGHKLFNCSKAIEICDNKALTHVELSNCGIDMPKTIIAPMTYSNIGYTDTSFLDQVVSKIKFPMIVKERCGSFGMQVYMVNTYKELEELLMTKEVNSLIFQEYIASSKGRDIRLQVVGDEVVTSMYRYSDNDFRANITNGGKAKKYTPTKTQCDIAVKVCKQLGVSFAGVDMLFGENDKPIVCEVNSNAHFVNIYNCTGVNTCEYIFDYIKDNIKNNI